MALGRRVASVGASWTRIWSVNSIACAQKFRPFQALPVLYSYSSLHTSSRPRQEVFHSQLDDPSNTAFLNSYQKPSRPQQTATEKILQRHALHIAPGKHVRSGDFITLQPRHCMTHDNSWPVATKFMDMGATEVRNNNQLVMTLDHDVQNKSDSNLRKYRQIEEFAKQQGVQFYPAGHGIGHQIMVEEGYAWPGTAVVASDSHTNMYGGLGCLGTPVVRTGAADIWATGTTWLKVPPIAKVNLVGTLPVGATGKDVIIALCALFNNDEVLNHAIEFTGSDLTLSSLSIDDRLAIANMTTEWGALSGLFPVDNMLKEWLLIKAAEAEKNKAAFASTSSPNSTSDRSTSSRINSQTIETLFEPSNLQLLQADPGARYAKSLFLDLSTVSPYVSGPNSVKVATPIQELEAQKIKVNRAYLVSCTNSRASDLASAAQVFRDAWSKGESVQVPEGVKLYIAAASAAEQRAAEESGDWKILLNAGAIALPPGCGPCIGLGTGLLEPGEVGISASNRNFKGRMGSTDAKAYLASPEVVAASALNGYISSPGWYQQPLNYEGMIAGEGDGISRRLVGIEEALEKIIADADEMIAAAEVAQSSKSATTSTFGSESVSTTAQPTTNIAPGFPTKLSGEIVFCDADNINTDGIYPGKYTYQDNVTKDTMAQVVMENYDPSFAALAKNGDILVSGFNFGTGSSREQAATAILAKGIPLVVVGSFGNIFATNSINNALMGLEVPRLVRRLREEFSEQTVRDPSREIKEPEGNEQSLDSATPTPVSRDEGGKAGYEKKLSRRTGWKLTWDVARSVVQVKEGENGEVWEEKVPEIPMNVQMIIAGGGLVKTRRREFGAE